MAMQIFIIFNAFQIVFVLTGTKNNYFPIRCGES